MKKRWFGRLLTALLVVLMLCALIFPASGSSTVYLMAVNDKVHETTVDNMPLVSGATLYVPYTMLSTQVTGINLGVRAQYDSGRGLLTVTDGEQIATFDVRRNTAYDSSGNSLTARALTRNTMAYLPVHWLCEYFPVISYSLNRTAYGALVRITNSAAVLTDDEFIFAADHQLRESLLRYQSSLNTSSPSPSPSPTPSPTPSPSPSPPPTVDPKPAPLVYLAFRADRYTARVASLLETGGQRALFLFTPSELADQDDLIRRLVGQGHQVGLALTGSDPEACLTQLSAGRQLMADIVRSPVFIVSADGLSSSDRQVLRDAGCAIWSATLEAGSTTSAALLNRLDPDQANYLQFTCDESGLALLTRTLSSLTGEDFRLRQALVPVL